MQLTTVTAYRKTASAQCILKQKNTEKKLINEIQKKKKSHGTQQTKTQS